MSSPRRLRKIARRAAASTKSTKQRNHRHGRSQQPVSRNTLNEALQLDFLEMNPYGIFRLDITTMQQHEEMICVVQQVARCQPASACVAGRAAGTPSRDRLRRGLRQRPSLGRRARRLQKRISRSARQESMSQELLPSSRNRRRRRCTLPLVVIGRASMNSISLGYS